MIAYNGPKSYLEFAVWHGRRNLRTERVGQAFFNDFNFEVNNSFYNEDVYLVISDITDALTEIYPDFFGGA